MRLIVKELAFFAYDSDDVKKMSDDGSEFNLLAHHILCLDVDTFERLFHKSYQHSFVKFHAEYLYYFF